MSRIKKAVIPAAGIGTRMAPISDYLPKPMLPLGKKPVLQHIIEELKEAGITEVGIVLHPDHEIVRNYFKDDSDISFIMDDSTSGPGGALLKAEDFIGSEPFLTTFSDAPVKGNRRGEHLRNLMELLENKEAAAALSIYPIHPEELSRRGIVTFEENSPDEQGVRITGMMEKPSPSEGETDNWASACRYVLGPAVMQALKEIDADEGGELQLTAALQKLIAKGKPLAGLPLDESLGRYDTGNFESYFEAFKAFTG